MNIRVDHNIAYNDLVRFAEYLLDKDGSLTMKRKYLYHLRDALCLEGEELWDNLPHEPTEHREKAIEIIDGWFPDEL